MQKKIFTFIELIVVISMLIITSTMIAAVISNSEKLTMACKDHLRKIGQAQKIYAAEHKGEMACQIHELQPLLGFKKNQIPDITGCPATPPDKRRKVFYGAEYGKNMVIFTPEKSWTGKSNWTSPDGNKIRNQISKYKFTQETMMFMDYPPEPRGGLCAVLSTSRFLTEKDPAAFRHDGKVNILYLDGHVGNTADVPLKDNTKFWEGK